MEFDKEKRFNRGDTIIYREEGDHNRNEWFAFTPVLYLGRINGRHKISFEDGRVEDDISDHWLHKDMDTAIKEVLAEITPYYDRTIAANRATIVRLEAERTSKVEELLSLKRHPGY